MNVDRSWIDPNESANASSTDLTRASIFQRLVTSRSADREMAWSEFRARYAPIIAGFAIKCGANSHDVDDIIQDVMASFLGASGEFTYDPTKGRFRGYLKTCTVRAAIKRAGKNLRFRGIPLEEIPQAELAVEPIWNDAWEQQLVARALSIIRDECQNSVVFQAFEQIEPQGTRHRESIKKSQIACLGPPHSVYCACLRMAVRTHFAEVIG